MVKLIIFDWDDVFTLGSKEAYIACYHEACVSVGIEVYPTIERERIFGAWGRPHRDVLASLLEGHAELVDQANSAYEKAILSDTFTNNIALVEGSVELLHELSQHYTLTIVTGSNPHLLKERIFTKFNIPSVFAQIITSYDLADRSRGKPHPDMVLKILADQNIPPNEAIVVGDAPGDIAMGKEAGVKTVAVLTGLLDREHAEQAGADHIIENVLEVKEILANLQHI